MGEPSRPLVSVLIPTRQRRDALRRALVALSSQAAPADTYEVIVSIDGSTDGTRELVAGFDGRPAVHAVEGPGCGRAAALNVAIEHARGEILVLLDDDMQAVPELIDHHCRHHPRGSRACVMGAAPILPDPGGTRAAGYVAAKFSEHLAKLARPDHVLTPHDFYSGNTSVRAEVLREIGCFDESFTRYGHEDVELFIRLRAAGVRIGYDPEALAEQAYDKDLRELAHDTVDAGATAITLVRVHPSAFARLPLADLDATSHRRIVVRAGLLALTRRAPWVTEGVLVLARALERGGLWRSRVFYDALLDYAYWTGVDAALARSGAKDQLVPLASELRRGPLDLLLHR